MLVVVATACGGGDVRLPSRSQLTRDIPPIVRRACREAAEQVSFRVVCPVLVPRTRYVHIGGLWGPIVFSPRLWLVTFNNGDNGPGYVHWIAGEGDRDDVRYYVLGDEQNAVKGLPTLWATKTVDGRTFFDYRFPGYPAGGPNGGHAAVFVPCGTRFVFTSLHDYRRLRLAEQMAIDLASRAGCPRAPRSEPARFGVMPAPPAVTRACDRVRRTATRVRTRWRIVCPPLVPWSPDGEVAFAGGVLSTRGVRRGYLIDGASTSPAMHWTFAAGEPNAVHVVLARAVGRPARIQGQRVLIYRVGPGGTSELSGHVAIEWTRRGQAYRVSVHSRSGDRPALVQATRIAAAVIGYLRHEGLPITRPQRPR